MTGQTISHYRILGKLGEGGMGSVYRAVDTRLGRTVAIKVVNAEFTQRFEREARAIAALNHPHICTLHDVGEHDGAPFLVMEFVEGKPLQGPLPVDEALGYAIQIAHALAAAHKAGIVHRDLKPDNILLTTEGSVKILDFGLAKLRKERGDETSSVSLTGQGAITGTAAYMSPEQAQGEPVDARSDIFSLGVVLYELVSGRRAFRRETMGATMAAVIALEPPPLKDAPPTVAQIVAKMLAKDREKRYQNAGELLKDLEAAAREKPWWQTRRAVVGMAATPVALAGAALGFNVRGWRTQLMNWMEPPAAAAIRLAVMPFVNMTGDPEQEYFSDGITQELIAQLGSLHPAGLNVIARTSVMRYKNTTKPLEEVARELKVEYLLEGSARREGGRARITTELIRVRDQIQLWAETFERELSGILVLQSEVARKVAGALALKLLPAEQARLAGVRQVNPEAYEAYLKGLQQWYKLTRQGLDAAMQQFELALRISPDYALAHAGVSLVWIGRQQMGVVPTLEAAPKLKAAAGEALALGEDLPEVRYVLALVKTWTDWDWAGGEQEFQRSIALNPSFPDARAYYSHLLVYLRRHDEALEQMARAMAMDPFNPLFQSLHARTLVILRRYDEAIGQARSALRVVQGLPVAVSALIDALNEKGMEAEAVEEWRADRTFRGDHRGIEAFDQGYREAGYRGAWRRFAEYRAVGFHKTGIGAIGIAAAFVRAGDTSQVLDWLEKAFEVRDPNLPYVFSDPKYATLRAEPRFQVLRRRMNLPD